MRLIYLLTLLVSLAGLGYLDYRYQLVLWKHRRAGIVTVIVGLAIFLLWDLAGIRLGIFFPGGSVYALTQTVLPGLPIEEFFFLALLSYLTLLLSRRLR